jgi:SAM-dependent methyltransferase
VEEMYGDWPISPEEIEKILQTSLDPRGSSSLFDTVGSLGLQRDAMVLDIGARDARQSVTLHQRFGWEVMAVEPVDANLLAARARIEGTGYADQIDVAKGAIEAIPAGNATFDLVFCRDVLSHVLDLATALRECHRVLKRGGKMVSYQTFATDLMEPGEASRIYPDLAVVASSMSPFHFESVAEDEGFRIQACDVIGSEWREAWEEDGTAMTSRQLLHAARLLRGADTLLPRLGETAYRVELSNALWGVYQMIGKLEPRIYVLHKP